MGGIIACVCCYCCLMTLKPRCIEIMALICSLIAIGFLIWGIAGIPWNHINTGGKVTFFITCAFVVLSFINLIILMCLRCGNKINTTKNGAGKCLCITMIVFDIIGLILIIIAEIIILYNMYDEEYEDYYYYDGYRRIRRRRDIFSDSEWAAAIISTSFAELALLVHSYCASFLLKLIKAKTDLSYLKYLESKEDTNIVGTTIDVVNNPPVTQGNQLTFIGYDNNGHPIYSGNTQYFIANQNQNNNAKVKDTKNNKLKVNPPK